MEAFSIEMSILEGKKELEELFEFVMNNSEKTEAYEMEVSIFSKVMQIGLVAMKCYFAQKGTGDVGDELELEDGQVLKKQSGLYGQDYFSVFGKFKVPRTCYRNPGQKGVMPLDAQANLPERCYSYLLQEWMDLFSIRDSFKESQISLEKLLGVEVSQSRFEVVSRESSSSYDCFYENKEIPSPESEGQIQVLEFDGKGVPVIKKEAVKLKARLGKGEKRQKKKEALVGISYTVDGKERTAEDVARSLVYPDKFKEQQVGKEGEESCVVRAQNVRRMASLERSKEEVVEEMSADAQRRDPEHNRPWVVVMDGALCLWNLVAKVLCGVEFVGILDIVHVTEYLWEAANVLYDEKDCKRQKWVYDHLLCILQGRVGWVIGGLKQTLSKKKLKKTQREVLEKVIRYFENHRKWMHYDQYLKQGYPIGSGVVESACAHTVKNRMEGSGRRWSINGAESTLLLRSVYTSNDWQAYWDAHRAIEKNCLYQNTLKALGHSIDCHNDQNSYDEEFPLKQAVGM